MALQLRRDMHKLFDNDPFFSDINQQMTSMLDSFDKHWNDFDTKFSRELSHFQPRHRTKTLSDGTQEIKLELPGMKKKDMRVYYYPERHRVSVYGKKYSKTKREKDTGKEKRFSSSEYSWQSSVGRDIERVEAKYHEGGVLTVLVIPKKDKESGNSSSDDTSESSTHHAQSISIHV